MYIIKWGFKPNTLLAKKAFFKILYKEIMYKKNNLI